jgi:hypothetical protein
MKRALVVNASAPHWNLGAHKLADWLMNEGFNVILAEGDPGILTPEVDIVWLSVIFSWHAPAARDMALRLRDRADVRAGGPGLFALGKWWEKETGLTCHRGPDMRFEYQRGAYRMTHASLGCPVGCYFCVVPKMEGLEFTLDWNFQPAHILTDNNLSALPVEFQEFIIKRYIDTGVWLADANSGFEPITFDTGTYERWKPIIRGPWRFAFDTTSEEPQVQRMMEILKDVSPRKKQVYCLIGNEPIAACKMRAKKIIAWGGEPFVQPMLPLNALDKHAYKIAFDWTADKLTDFTRFYNRHLWRSFKLEEYRHSKSRPASFTQDELDGTDDKIL